MQASLTLVREHGTMTRQLPSPDILRDWAAAAAVNAATLIFDARTLARSARWARSYALAVLALEEIGKAHRCLVTADAIANGDVPASRAFYARIGRHEQKLLDAHTFLNEVVALRRLDADLVRNIGLEAETQASIKMLGLYVDVDGDNILVPESSITEAQAKLIIENVDSTLPAILWFTGQAAH